MDVTDFTARLDAITVEQLRAGGGAKWSRHPETLGAWIAEMDFGIAPPVTEALTAHVASGQFGYTTPRDRSELARAYSQFARRRYGWDVDPEWVRPAPDVLSVFGAVLDEFTSPGDKVVLPTPAYMPFLTLPAFHDREIVQVPMLRDEDAEHPRWRFDLDGLAAAFADGGAVLVLCNPVNPLGQVLTATEMLEVADVVEDAGAIVFSDEIHAPVVYREFRHTPYATLDHRTAAHSITATSASKGFNLPGLKCAQAVVTSPEHRERWAERCWPVEEGASRLGYTGAIAAYDEGEPWLDEILAYLDRNRHALTELTAEHLPEAGYVPPEGTYLTLLHLPQLGQDPAAMLREEAGLVLTPGTALGRGGEGCVRLNFATPLPVLTEIVERIGAVVRAH
ncbi:MalY/PatB family protein [Mobilicoccus pelagius]|uniref:cysteine-S-conjugate beta-lyase n=1 Tax=Mobilicoccus pelagius NBRC 104925 TaxID=1089455 RepID=H5UV65_9MICO|nr:aminotransferase class I/II-fold pyridoxal phosphate-dependent enzyme [Mobilicoccus pelagius]GAB49623.1 putative cystathionine beta-lyase [Mobilicoccus pelagius NBRC 104925]